MRCKKHYTDLSSTVGVCASCLRERLFSLIAAQVQAQQQAQLARALSHASEESRRSDPSPPPLVFPRSVSPYVTRRKSDDSAWQHHNLPDLRFYSTPQVRPTHCTDTGGAAGYHTTTAGRSRRKKKGKSWIFTNLFRTRSEKFGSDLRDSSQDSREPSSLGSPSWFSSIFPGRRKKASRNCRIGDRAVRDREGRGMSPVWAVETEDECDLYNRSPSPCGFSSEASPRFWRTPVMATPSEKRRNRQNQGQKISGMAFCLSPLVRPSPNRPRNPKSFTPELTLPGEIRVTNANPHLASAASYVANRSRKLVDFGRVNHNR